jgi:hypothetical protein
MTFDSLLNKGLNPQGPFGIQAFLLKQVILETERFLLSGSLPLTRPSSLFIQIQNFNPTTSSILPTLRT